MLCAWAGRQPWARYTSADKSLQHWKLADKAFATDGSGASPGGGAGALFQKLSGGSDDLYAINMDTGATFAVGHYDPKAEKLHLVSGPDGKMVPNVIDYSRTGTYKWAATGHAADGRLLTMAWVDEGECAPDSPVGPAPRDCNGMRHRSVMSLPRELLYDATSQQLVSRPVAELATLRNASFIDCKAFTLAPRSGATALTEIPASAGGALDLELSFEVSEQPQRFGVAVRAGRASLVGAGMQLQFNVSAPNASGVRRVSVRDIAHAGHQPPRPTQLTRWMNDSDLGAGDYNVTHHNPASGDTAATCQAMCDADNRCAAWVWVVRGLPAGSADCCLKSAAYDCPARAVGPHPCHPCTITSGVKDPGSCTSTVARPAAAFTVAVLPSEKLTARILVDRPLVDVFVQGGRGAFVAASNFSKELSSVHLVNEGAVAVQATASAWGMGCGWAAQLPSPSGSM